MPIGHRAVMPQPFEITFETFDLPEPGAGQVLIETEASAVSPGTELAIYTGIHQWLSDPRRSWPKFPFVPGYSAVGRVLAVGEEVQGLAPGQRVVWAGRHESHALVHAGSHPTPDRAIWPIAESVPAPAAACALLARFPLAALVRAGQLLGQSVAVLGLGLIGQLTLRLYAAAGAYPLIGLDPVAFRREVASHVAGAAVLDPDDGELNVRLRELNHGALPDIVVDATGVPDAVRMAMAIVADGGQVIMVGSPRGIAGDVDFYHDLHGRSISLVGAHGSSLGVEPREKFPFTRERAMRLLLHLLASNRLSLDHVITQHTHARNLHAMYEGLLRERDSYLAVTLHW